MPATYMVQLQNRDMPYLTADSLLHSETNLQQLSEVKWSTWMPKRIDLTKALVKGVSFEKAVRNPISK